ncbi:uncharacterized protein F5891DRAFT_592513 [Suillus fuscotomentosus]|uniref:Uncharacterized protein n=1 Tax=Suillus fuscotomentosus TaxID=1912939 RepID=A0AAD4HI69_9AGAM|nr:uncharacterized protein F5891DRAFT_592513 [Suillus fuscotomentosus]KAG1896414.1 hypothetical protein F5891DRAFT_592513 [Suillus fuscotomentosus]
MISRLSSDTLLLLSLVHGIVASRPTRTAQTDNRCDRAIASQAIRASIDLWNVAYQLSSSDPDMPLMYYLGEQITTSRSELNTV